MTLVAVGDEQTHRIVGLAADYRWDGRLENGASAPPGLYFLRAVRGGQAWVGKVLVQR